MKKQLSYSLILIGLWVRSLQHAESLSIKSVKKGINVIKEDLENFQFNVSISGTSRLIKFTLKLDEADENELIGKTRANDLEDIMKKLENIIYAESCTKFYYVTSERRYNHNYLIESPDKLFSNEVFNSLPIICKYDFSESFRCLAYEVPTASAFHILRGTEGYLKELYFAYIKRNREKKPMWNNMVNQLKNKSRNSPPASLLDALDNIRKSYRNPTNHPEAIYSISEAEDLIGLCIDVVNKIYKAIPKT